jgi:hypothetical protein
MSRLLRAILPFLICLTSLFCPGFAGAHPLSDSQASNNGELEPANIQPHSPIGIDARRLVRVRESIIATPEPVSLALFGSGLTLMGIALLRYSRRTKAAMAPRDALSAVDKRFLRLARNANRAQYPRPNVPAPKRLVSTYVSSGGR